tara:strand:- start:70464 stop:71123 length:660 start_codon:yes stop_codon:yes gene_type:complete
MLFVSKKVTYAPLLDFLREKNIVLNGQSMIEFEPVDFNCPDPSSYDIIFFSSQRAASFYLENCSIPSSVQIATIGATTSSFLRKRGINVDFEGEKSGDPQKVASEFASFIGNKKVLFPQSDRSQRSMQRQLDSDQVIDLIVYSTLLRPIKLAGKCQTLVFTSPSNVEAFLRKNQISIDQKVVAWGNTTKASLEKEQIKVDHTLEKSSFEELTNFLRSIY